jgi:hypothetical protein
LASIPLNFAYELAFDDPAGAIHLQKPGGDACFCTEGDDLAVTKFVVFVPDICSWMKQRREVSGLVVDGCDIAAFESFAKGTAQSEIRSHSGHGAA